MKKYLLWFLIIGITVSMLATFSLTSCKKGVTPTEATSAETSAGSTTAVETGSTEAETQESAAGEIDTEGTITVGENHIYRSMDPAVGESSLESCIYYNVYEGLTAYNKDKPGEPLPALAESWDVNSDATEWTFHLRKDVKFTTGNIMTSEDVVYSLKRGIKQSSPQFPPLKDFIDPEKGFQIIDNYTIKMSLLNGFAGLPSLFSLGVTGILDKTELEKHITTDDPIGTKWLNDNSIGTGPFYLKEWVRNERIVLQKNENYWGIEANYLRVPKYKTFISLNVQEPATAQMMLEKGDIDFSKELSKDIMTQLETNPDVKVENNLVYIETGLLMNQKFKPFTDAKIRQAIKYAIDYDTICGQVLSAIRLDRPIMKPAIGSVTDNNYLYGYDLEKAKQLMSESGYPDGFEFSLAIGTGIGLGAEWEALGLKLQSDLAKIGVTVKLEQYDWSVMDEKAATANYEGLLLWTGPYYADAGGHVRLFKTDDFYLGKMDWKSDAYAAYNKLADEALKEPNLDKRVELYNELSKVFIEEAPVAPIGQELKNVVFRSDIYGWNGNPDMYQSDYAVLYRKK